MNDDLISRQAAVDEFPEKSLPWDTFYGYIAPHYVRKILERLPSAQPKIITCKDCKHNKNNEWVDCPITEFFGKTLDNYCSLAERKTNETD